MSLARLLFPFVLIVVLAGCASRSNLPQDQAYVARDTSRTVDLTHPPRDVWDRIRRGFAIPNLHSDEVDHWTRYYASHPQAVVNMSARASRYLYYIVDAIERRGLPTELALLPFVESAYDPRALSRSQAAGLWQFIPSTGRHYKLEQDWWRDQRRDPVASTQAALDYLAYLYEMQGDWYLALASYNWGEGAVRRAMDRAGQAGQPALYTTINLPSETRNYVPKLQAIKNIVAQPARYGVALPEVPNAPYFVTIHKARDMDVAVAAALAEMPLDEFEALNPAHKRPLILGTQHAALHLPLDRLAVFNENLERYDGPLSAWRVVHPRRGESLAQVARAHGTTVAALREINGLSARTTTVRVATLLVPEQATQPAAPTVDGGVRVVAYTPPSASTSSDTATPRVRRIPRAAAPVAQVHTIRRGETLYSLARRYNTSVDALKRLNNLHGSALSTGQRLRVPGTDVRG